MPTPTDDHRRTVRRAITLAGMPPPFDPVARSQRRELIEALAAALADAEVRGPVGGRTDPTNAEEAAYRHGLGQAFAESLALLDAPDPAASIRAAASSYGVVRELTGSPTGAAAALLRTAQEASHD